MVFNVQMGGLMVAIVVLFLTFVMSVIAMRRPDFFGSVKPKRLESTKEEFINEQSLMDGTPMESISTFRVRRFPFAVETPHNWYNTQPTRPKVLGTNMGAEKCWEICN